MIIDCVSDLHGHLPNLEGGDLLIVAGDLTAGDKLIQYHLFDQWLLGCQEIYQEIVVIGGNHDGLVEKNKCGISSWGCVYLCDSGCSISYYSSHRNSVPPDSKSVKIWGSPWTKTFPGIDPNCCAFMLDHEADLKQKWAMIPDDTDILITHLPPWGIRDCVIDFMNGRVENVGSTTLLERVNQIKPKLHVFGHIHEGYGEFKAETHFVNASIMNERYKPVNKPIRVIL